MRLIESHGFHGTSMAMVAKEAGVAAGTIYLYFKSKDEVIAALYARERQRLETALPAHQASFKKTFMATYQSLADYLVNHPAAFGFMAQYLISPFMSADQKRPHQALCPLLLQGQKAGILRQQAVELMAALVYGHLAALAQLQLQGEPLSVTTVQEAAQACWESIRID